MAFSMAHGIVSCWTQGWGCSATPIPDCWQSYGGHPTYPGSELWCACNSNGATALCKACSILWWSREDWWIKEMQLGNWWYYWWFGRHGRAWYLGALQCQSPDHQDCDWEFMYGGAAHWWYCFWIKEQGHYAIGWWDKWVPSEFSQVLILKLHGDDNLFWFPTIAHTNAIDIHKINSISIDCTFTFLLSFPFF